MRLQPTARGHADLILPMVDELLRESTLALSDFDVLAFGRGPGSFTGVRIAVAVIQGLALAAGKPVVGVSTLAAVAHRAVVGLTAGARILVCMDARMGEVYWAEFQVIDDLNCQLASAERVGAPMTVDVEGERLTVGVGTGWRAYPQLRARYPRLHIDDAVLPRAIDIAYLARAEFRAGHATSAAQAQPVYLRDNVVARSGTSSVTSM